MARTGAAAQAAKTRARARGRERLWTVVKMTMMAQGCGWQERQWLRALSVVCARLMQTVVVGTAAARVTQGCCSKDSEKTGEGRR